MKLTTLVLIATMLHVSAASVAQKLTLTKNNISLNEVFKEIRKQTGYNILWQTNKLNDRMRVDANFNNTPLADVLREYLPKNSFDFVIKDKTIAIVAKKDATIFDRLSDYFNMINIRSKVTDKNGNSLPGASVKVKETGKVATTDASGIFILSDVDPKATILISYIGYETLEISASALNVMNAVVLTETPTKLSEVAVISTGYQTLKRSQLTGAYASIGRDTYMQSVPANGNITDNLEGRLAGLMLNINQSRANWYEQGNTSPFVIRGVSTFQAIKKPLIVLNGYPTEVDIESINPYDIESVTILKDAASAAIYGVRASNGVVVINTRKGSVSNNKPAVRFSTALTYRPKPDYNKLDLIKGRDYVDFEIASANNYMDKNFTSKDQIDMMNGTYTPVFSITDDLRNGKISQEQADKMYNEIAAYDNTEDYKKLFLQNQLLQTYDMNVSGGSTNATYFFGVNHQNNAGSGKFSGYNRTSLNYRGTFDFSKRINLDVQTAYSNSNSKSVPIPEYNFFKPYQHFMDASGNAVSSYFAPFNENYYGFGLSDGTISAARNAENMAMGLYDEMYSPYTEMFESSNKTVTNVYRAQGNLKVNLLSGLNLELGGVLEKQNFTNTELASEKAYPTRIMLNYFAKKDPFTGKPVFSMPQGGVKKTTDNDLTAYTLRAQLTYNKLIAGKHDLSFLGGIEQRKNTSNAKLNTIFGYDSQTLIVKPADLSLLGNQNYMPEFVDVIVSGVGGGFAFDQTDFSQFFNESFVDDRFLSYYGNGAYTYDGRYSVTGSIRIDQSNLFGTDPKFRYTPLWSAGFAWNLRNENFMKNAGWLSELKLRLAAGYNGNIKKGSGPFNLLRSSVNNYVPNPVVGYTISAPRNNSLRWEKTFNFNAGLDFGLLSGRLSGTVDYYIKSGKDIFSPIEADPTLGFTNLLTNNASIENRGVDLSLSSLNVKQGEFSWRTQVTGSFNRSKVLKVKNTYVGFYNFTRAGMAENVEGHPMSSILALDYAGLNADGKPMVRDDQGNLVVLSFMSQTDVPFSALKFAGVTDPKYALGFNNQFSLGDFNLSALLMYYGGHVALVRPPSIFDERPGNGIQNFWKKPGDELTTNVPGFGGAYGTPQYVEVRNGYNNGLQFVRKMDYVALRNVTLSYSLKDRVTKKLGLSSTKLILQVQNPVKYVFSGNDVDPETLDFTGRRGLPVVPSYTFSLSTNF
uniref:SusC/RagA family TonB-linked outer membrane protein n=1 Tax=Pedobacter schmidteae TaxID=2201271 RepID=UPI0013CE7E61|nr:SusC/RagA family TonB-linked outer membrane protein [Pedobacter schmidteae]